MHYVLRLALAVVLSARFFIKADSARTKRLSIRKRRRTRLQQSSISTLRLQYLLRLLVAKLFTQREYPEQQQTRQDCKYPPEPESGDHQ